MANTADSFQSFDEALEHMHEPHLHCRDYGHTWRPSSARWVDSQRLYEQSLRCTRCRTVRHRLIAANGEIVGSHYDYADHYLMKGIGRLTGSDRAALRLASVTADMQPKPSSRKVKP